MFTFIILAVIGTAITFAVLQRRGHLSQLLISALLFWPFALVVSFILGAGDATSAADE